jgi:hypothetical protein
LLEARHLSGFGRLLWAGAILLIGIGGAKLHAQSVLGDPKDAPKVFASTCSACHKSPQGLAKSGQVAGFLRQHYTTGPEMSAAMAAYLVAAGSGPAGKKGAATAAATPGEEGDAKAKAKEAREKAKEAREKAKEAREKKKQEQLAAAHPAGEAPGAAAAEGQKQSKQGLRGKQRSAKQPEPETVAPAAAPVEQPAAKPPEPPAEERKQAAVAVPPAPAAPPAPSLPVGSATTGTAGQVELNIPLPPMPEAAPPELSQSAFSSSPLP